MRAQSSYIITEISTGNFIGKKIYINFLSYYMYINRKKVNAIINLTRANKKKLNNYIMIIHTYIGDNTNVNWTGAVHTTARIRRTGRIARAGRHTNASLPRRCDNVYC